MDFKEATILIATFSPWKNGVRLPINGNLEPMLDFFVPRAKRVVLIDQVYPGSDGVMPRVEVYEKNKHMRLSSLPILLYFLYPFLWVTNVSGTQIVFKVRDYLSVVFEGLRTKQPYELFIGFEAVNALAGVLLRTIGKVKCVVYYVSDYSPNRYAPRWFNALYLWLDRMACYKSDVIWDVSNAMMHARIGVGLDPNKSAPVIHVPNALYPKQIQALPLTKIKKNTAVFLGTLGFENGPDIAVTAAAKVVRVIPSFVLHIIGGDEPNEQKLKILAKQLRVEDHVVFHGFIHNREEVSQIARSFQVALAPYKYIPGSARLYGDATKIRAYLASGLPVITTRVPPLGKDVEEAGAGIITKDTAEAFAKAVILLLRNSSRYSAMRKAAIRFAKENTWDSEYQKAWLLMKKQRIV